MKRGAQEILGWWIMWGRSATSAASFKPRQRGPLSGAWMSGLVNLAEADLNPCQRCIITDSLDSG